MDQPDIEAPDIDGGDRSLLDRLRGTGVGVEDPNIVGDVGPTDIPPGRDPGTGGGLFADPPESFDPTESVEPLEPVDSVEPPDLLGPGSGSG